MIFSMRNVLFLFALISISLIDKTSFIKKNLFSACDGILKCSCPFFSTFLPEVANLGDWGTVFRECKRDSLASLSLCNRSNSNPVESLPLGFPTLHGFPGEIKKTQSTFNFYNRSGSFLLQKRGVRPRHNLLFSPHSITRLLDIPPYNLPTGSQVKVGIIDSGIDFTHPALGGCYGPDCRVRYGRVFSECHHLPEHLKGTPFDEVGHGTFIAGVVGGKDSQLVGVAPNVVFGSYKIHCCNGVIKPDLITQGIEAAVKDGMDIIVLSIGALSWPHQWLIRNKFQISNTLFITSAGNSGDLGPFKGLNDMAAMKDVIAVGSVDAFLWRSRVAMVHFNDKVMGMSFPYLSVSQDNEHLIVSNPWVALSIIPEVDQYACSPLNSLLLNSTVVLVQTGGCPLQTKLENLVASDVAGVIFYPPTGMPFPSDTCFITHVPVAKLASLDAEKTVQMIKENIDFDVEIVFMKEEVASKTLEMSTFSSWGPGLDFSIKPDVVAPGGMITSTTTMIQGKYDTKSGTSFSAPYVAGLAALFHEKYPSSSYYDFHRALMNNAIPVKDKLQNVVSVSRQGAGLVNAAGLLMNPLSVFPFKVELGMLKHKETVTFTVANNGDTFKKIKVTHVPALTVGGTGNDRVGELGYLEVTFTREKLEEYSFEIAAGSEKEILIYIEENDEGVINSCDVKSGYLYFQTISGGDVSYMPIYVPYLGMNCGGIQKIREKKPTISKIEKWTAFEMPEISVDNNKHIYYENSFSNFNSSNSIHSKVGQVIQLQALLKFPVKMVTVELFHPRIGQYFKIYEEFNIRPPFLLQTEVPDLLVGKYQLRIMAAIKVAKGPPILEEWNSAFINVTL